MGGNMSSTKNEIFAAEQNDFKILFQTLWEGKFYIISTAVIFSAVAVFYALRLPNLYRADVLLSPVTEQSSGLLSGQLGGLAAMAGINLGAAGGADKSPLALEILKSRDFINRFVQGHQLTPAIMAAKSWNSSTGELSLDDEIYDSDSNKWVRKVKAGKPQIPSAQETYEEFLKILQINIREEKRSRLVTISIEHLSPLLAQQWVTLLVKDINEEMKRRDQLEAEKSIVYLNQKIEETALSEIKSSLYSMVEEQTKILMMTNVRDEYVFKTIDPAVVPEDKSRPKRALIVIFSGFFGLALSMFVLLIRRTVKLG